jgi:hypothetical protein
MPLGGGGRRGGGVALRSLFAMALQDFRDATGILNIDKETQYCRSLPARRTTRVLTVFVDIGDVQEENNGSRAKK